MRTMIRYGVMTICLAGFASHPTIADTSPAEVRALMRQQLYGEVLERVDALLETGVEPADELLFLKARALFLDGNYEETVAVTKALESGFPQSEWYYKARFLRAQALAEQRDYRGAEVVYADDAHRLLSGERKALIARVIIDLADELSREPDEKKPDAPSPDYNRAHRLYRHALDLEIGSDVREELMFKMTRAMARATNHSAVLRDAAAYLSEFDPAWGQTPKGAKADLKGEYWVEVRMFLIRAHLGQNQHGPARREIENLLALRNKDEAVHAVDADLRWLLIKSYRLPEPLPQDADSGIVVARRFLEIHPGDPRAVMAALLVPTTLEKIGRTDAAIEAYNAFIDGHDYILPDGAAARVVHPDLEKSPAAIHEQGRPHARFRMGKLAFMQRDYSVAIDHWQHYISQFPNGPDWSEAHSGMLNARFDQGLLALEEKRGAEARALFEDFLKQHPLDERAPTILFIFGQQHYARAVELKEKDGDREQILQEFNEGIAEWRNLISRFPESDKASLAKYRTGRIQEEELGDFDAALQTYRELTWGPYRAQATRRIALMTRKTLDIRTERTFRTSETPSVRVETRNIEKLTVRVYRLDMDSYFRKMHGIGAVEKLDVSLIEPDLSWTVDVEDYRDYMPFTSRIAIPFEGNAPGAMVVNVSDEKEWQATTLVLRSDLELILKSSRREALVFVQDMLRDETASGVRVLFSDGETVFKTGVTGDDGVLHLASNELKQVSDLRVFAIRDGHVAGFDLDISALNVSIGLSPKGYIYTDRSAYQPGDTVAARGIIRDVRDGEYVVPGEIRFTVSVLDPDGRLMHEESVELSDFGSFHINFPLAEAVAVGDYTIQAVSGDEGKADLISTGKFKVQHVKLEKIRLTIDFPEMVYFRGETVEALIKAEYYWGEPLADAAIRYTLPDGREFTGRTGSNGELAITFDTAYMVPGAVMSFGANIEAEGIAVKQAVTLARLGYSAKIDTAREVVLAGEPFDITITTTAADGRPVGRQMTLFVLRRATRETDPLFDFLPGEIDPPSPPMAEVTIAEHEINTDPETGKAQHTLELERGGEYIFRVAGEDRFEQPVTAEGSVRVSDAEDETRLRLFAESEAINVGDRVSVQLHSRAPAGRALVTHEGETILHYEIVTVNEGFNDLLISVGHEHFPNMQLTASLIDGRRLRTVSRPFTVQRRLNVEVRPMKEHFIPGESGRVELRVTDQLGRPVVAELSLALVDEALFALYPDETPAIRDFFERDAHRYAEFQTGSTCAFEYSGVTRPVDEADLAERERLEREMREGVQRREMVDTLGREFDWRYEIQESAQRAYVPAADIAVDDLADYARYVPSTSEVAARERPERDKIDMPAPRDEMPDEGFWLPDVVTDEQGRAVVEIPMPEKTTEWRLTARGCTPETLVGEATAQTLTRKDFFVSIKAPSFVREGDTIRVIGRVHNLTDAKGTVRMRLEVYTGQEGKQLVATRDATVEVDAESGAEAVFRGVDVPPELELHLTLSAGLDDYRDVLRMRIPSVPWGMEQAAHDGGVTDIDATVLLGLPADMTFLRQWMTIVVGPDAEQSIIDMALDDITTLPGVHRGELFPRPPVYGDNTAGQLLGAVHALKFARRSEEPMEKTRRLEQRVRALVGSLVATQHSDGGWSWHPGTTRHSDWLVTSQAYWGLVSARDLGIGVHSDTLSRATAYLENRFRSFPATDHEGKSVVLQALAVNGKADFAHVNRLYRERSNLSNTALAYTTLTFIRLERMDFARELTDLLLAERAGPVQPYWPHAATHQGLKNDTHTTALVLLILAHVQPERDVGHDIARYLFGVWDSHRSGAGQARGVTLAALAEWFGRGERARSDLEIEIRVNNHPLTTLRTRNSFDRVTLPVPREYLVAGLNRIEFKKSGAGSYTYAASLYGFSSEIRDPQSWRYPYIRSRKTYHEGLRYDGRPLSVRSTSEISALESGRRTLVEIDFWSSSYPGYLMVEEPLPAGAVLVEDSVQGSFEHYERRRDRLLFYFRPGSSPGNNIRYQLVGYVPGEYRAPPTIMRDAVNPGHMRLGGTNKLVVLAPGEVSDEPYAMNRDELFALGRAYFQDHLYEQALRYLTLLHKEHREYSERDVARMLLWIHTEPEFYEPRIVVEMFEVLRERHPSLEIPFDKILVVGRAYRDIDEFERAWLIYRSTIAASFISDSNISAILDDERQFMASIDYQKGLWLEYPDSADVVSAYFALSQALYGKAPLAHQLPEEDGVQPEKVAMLGRAAEMLMKFLTLYPENPLADNAAFSLANAFLDLRDYDTVIELGRRFALQYKDSPLAGSFQYMTALGLFWKGEREEALEAATVVAGGTSRDRRFAQYIVGQIHHAQGQPGEAINWYRKVQEEYADAAEAIEYFESQSVKIEEINIFRPDEDVVVTLHHRNIDDVLLQIYRVDLMKLYLREKDLSRITDIHLAGIAPLLEKSISLADEPDYRDLQTDVLLDLDEKEGAYLVIYRGDDLFTSGLVLLTTLDIEVQEYPQSGRLRANVLDTVSGGYRARVHVKAIGSMDTKFREGDTDLRGIFVADNLRGKATVIAREGESRYAFHRGETWFGPRPDERPVPERRVDAYQEAPDYQQHLRSFNVEMQKGQVEQFDRSRRAGQRGVQVQEAY